VTFSVDDETPSLRSVRLWIIRQSVARLVVFRRYADPETLWVPHADRPCVAPPGVGPLLCVVLPLCPLICTAEVSSLCVFYVTTLPEKYPRATVRFYSCDPYLTG
jgi:hypothetical protein